MILKDFYKGMRVKYIPTHADGNPLHPDCKNEHFAKGHCQKHYTRLRRHGDPFYKKGHGMAGTLEHNTWRGMRARCINKNNVGYYLYGGRGITVCERWLNSFKNFYEDMGSKPFPKARIDRINNDLGYFKENCHWTTNTQNCRKQSKVKLSMEKARTIRKKYKMGNISQPKLALIYGVCPTMINNIINQKAWIEQS